jgi:glutamate-1-semialdehyde aminotransferase
MFGFFFCKGPVTCFEEALAADTKKFARFHRGMLEEGVYLAPSQVGRPLAQAVLCCHCKPPRRQQQTTAKHE